MESIIRYEAFKKGEVCFKSKQLSENNLKSEAQLARNWLLEKNDSWVYSIAKIIQITDFPYTGEEILGKAEGMSYKEFIEMRKWNKISDADHKLMKELASQGASKWSIARTLKRSYRATCEHIKMKE